MLWGFRAMITDRYRCPDCGSSDAYRSRRRGFVEKFVQPFLLLKPVRCANCFRRSATSLFTSARVRETRPAVRSRVA